MSVDPFCQTGQETVIMSLFEKAYQVEDKKSQLRDACCMK